LHLPSPSGNVAPFSQGNGLDNDNSPPVKRSSTAALTLLALGIVYGDIGTSPLYAVKATFSPEHGIPLNSDTILGGLSAIFWSLMIVVTLKYVTLVMRADNKGEGGIMALLALATSAVKDKRPRWARPVMLLGLIGACLFYGEVMLTPAISVVSAIEGLEVGVPALKPYVLPLSIIVLITLFVFQRHGTAAVGTLFGPICALWFVALAAVGIYNIAQNPTVLNAIHPAHALHFATGHGFASFVILGAVMLAITGAESLYADMGHLGKMPIRIAWFSLVLPSLVLNYFGQGALLIRNPEAISNPFFLAYPSWALFPMVGLATAATVIASQAVISAAYSMTKQAIQLGYLPRMNIVHTSAKKVGQIYIPAINWILLVAVLITVIGFGSSSRLAAAYGVAVVGTMLITTFLTFFVIRYRWDYPLWLCLMATGFFMVWDAVFLGATWLKIPDGGWFPLTIAAAVFIVMVTWRHGRETLMTRLKQQSIPLDAFLGSLLINPPVRVPGTAVFLNSAPNTVPHALLHNLVHNKVLHERVVFLTVTIKDEPFVPATERVEVSPLGQNCYRILMYFGFKDRADVPLALALCEKDGLEFQTLQTSFFLSRETVIPRAHTDTGMSLWRERVFSAMARNAGSVVEYFNLPTNRVIELGTQIEI
jgi:KUP system potassium uptake protein